MWLPQSSSAPLHYRQPTSWMPRTRVPSSGTMKSGEPLMKLNSQEEGLSIIQKTLRFVTGKSTSQLAVAIAQLATLSIIVID